MSLESELKSFLVQIQIPVNLIWKSYDFKHISQYIKEPLVVSKVLFLRGIFESNDLQTSLWHNSPAVDHQILYFFCWQIEKKSVPTKTTKPKPIKWHGYIHFYIILLSAPLSSLNIKYFYIAPYTSTDDPNIYLFLFLIKFRLWKPQCQFLALNH